MPGKIQKINIKLITISTLLILFFSYSAMVYTVGTEPDNHHSASALAAEGKLVFQNYNCISCHQLYGLGGYMGPDLTNVISAPGKGELYAKVLIAYGTAKMPDFNIPEHEQKALIEYLKYVDKTGSSPDFTLAGTLWGDIKNERKNITKTESTDSLITLKTNAAE